VGLLDDRERTSVRAGAYDRLIHPEQRLRICAALRPLEVASFRALREDLGITDSALSKHVRILSEAGYLDIVKESHVPRPRTWISLTTVGRNALEEHLAWLRVIAQRADSEVSTQ
ncbi:MAG: transcriptional regulator, partial [Ornithinimicrobium sp.]